MLRGGVPTGAAGREGGEEEGGDGEKEAKIPGLVGPGRSE